MDDRVLAGASRQRATKVVLNDPFFARVASYFGITANIA